jgi:hypothetical protein
MSFMFSNLLSITEKEEEAKQKSKGKEAAPHTQTDTSNRKKASHKSGKDDDSYRSLISILFINTDVFWQ